MARLLFCFFCLRYAEGVTDTRTRSGDPSGAETVKQTYAFKRRLFRHGQAGAGVFFRHFLEVSHQIGTRQLGAVGGANCTASLLLGLPRP